MAVSCRRHVERRPRTGASLSTLTNGYAVPASASDPFTERLADTGPDGSGDVVLSAAPAIGHETTTGGASVGGGGGGGGSWHHMAMPQLLGAPAYARPPRLVAESPRPLDPDDLPIQAMRSPEDEALLAAVYQPSRDDAQPTIQPSSQGGLRAVASRLFGSGA
jgi:hypothetical protein